MVFARNSRSEASEDRSQGAAAPEPSVSKRGRVIDPFAAEKAFPDPTALAEKVVFKLWSEGVVKGRAIEQARREAGEKLRLDQALTRFRLANPEDVAAALAEEMNAPLTVERDFPEKPVMKDHLPWRFVREAMALPLEDDGETLVLAMADPLDDYALRAIAMKTRRKISVKVACANRLEREFDRLYPIADRRMQRALPAPSRQDEKSGQARAIADRSAQPRSAQPRSGDERPAPDRGTQDRKLQDRKLQERPTDAPLNARRAQPVETGARAAFASAAPSFVRRRKDAPDQAQPSALTQNRTSDARPMTLRNEELVEETSRDLERDLARSSAPVNAPSEVEKDAKPKKKSGWGIGRPSFVRPRRVTLKNKVERSAVRAEEHAAPELHVRDARRQAETQPERNDQMRADAPRRDGLRPDEMRREEMRREEAPRAAMRRDEEGRRETRPTPRSAEGGAPAHAPRQQPAPKPVQTQRSGADPEQAALAASAPGSIAAQVREQVAARRAERERAAAEGRGVGPIPDELDDDFDLSMPPPPKREPLDEDAPLRFGEIHGHASAARAKTSPSRLKVLEQMREALGLRGGAATKDVPTSAEKKAVVEAAPEGDNRDEKLRYQAAEALKARAEMNAATPPTAVRLPQVEPLKRFHGAASEQAKAGGEKDLLAGIAVDPAAKRALDEAQAAQDGLILVAGPSGSGKIDTVRRLAALRAGDKSEAKRFDEPGVTFPRDSEFRVYWGEIRDAESAEAAARAAMNGALVIATLDAASAPASPGRLIALGLPPYALASGLRAVLAQKMDEKGCTRCAETGRGPGGADCQECGGDGRSESVRIGESMVLDDAMRALILSDAPEEAYRHAMQAATKKSSGAARPATLSSRREKAGEARL